MAKEMEERFNRAILKMFLDLLRVFLWKPDRLFFLIRVMLNQQRAADIRRKIATAGKPAPAILIFSITNECNLKCAGCYNFKNKQVKHEQLPPERIIQLFKEVQENGIGIVMIAGGEPFLNLEILRIAASFPGLLFPVFTNGTLIGENIGFLKNNRCIIPVLSLEGDRHTTDNRRGTGLYDSTIKSADILRKKRSVFGFSITLMRNNADDVLTDKYIKPLVATGCCILFFIEYVPNNHAEVDLCITPEQKKRLIFLCREFEKKYSAIFVSLPGDEEMFGGCLAAGRGFVHINAGGDVEPCPFAPFSTVNIKDCSLQDALQTRFMKQLRESGHLLTESRGGCTLWENRDWVETQLRDNGKEQ